MLVEGVKLFLPAGTSALTSEHMAHLNAGAAKWQLYEFDERHDELTPIDLADRGNVSTRLVRCPEETAVLERFAEPIHRVLSLLRKQRLRCFRLRRWRSAGVDISQDASYRRRNRCCFWLPPLCTSIPQPTQYCDMWIPRSIGRGWGSMNGGGRS